MSVYAGKISTGMFAPRGENGEPLPNTEFFLYLPGTTTPPTFYTNRTKSATVSGPPRTDSRGNVDPSVQWVEPGFYDYWYNGEIIESGVEVTEDNSEDDVALSAAIDEINDDLDDNYYTKTEVDDIIAGTGDVTGAELQANKGIPGGYAELNDPGGVVPDDQLPDSATTGDRNPTAHASTHAIDGSDEVPQSNFVTVDATPYEANFGETVYCPVSLGTVVVQLPPPEINRAPITVIPEDESSSLTQVEGMDDTYQMGRFASPVVLSATFECDDTAWYLKSAYLDPDQFAPASTTLAELAGFLLSSSQIAPQNFTGTEYPDSESIVGNVGAFQLVRCTNAAGCTIRLGENGAPGDSITVIQGSSVQVTFSPIGGATIVEPDGYSKTRKQNAVATATCISNSEDLDVAVWLISGDTGP